MCVVSIELQKKEPGPRLAHSKQKELRSCCGCFDSAPTQSAKNVCVYVSPCFDKAGLPHQDVDLEWLRYTYTHGATSRSSRSSRSSRLHPIQARYPSTFFLIESLWAWIEWPVAEAGIPDVWDIVILWIPMVIRYFSWSTFWPQIFPDGQNCHSNFHIDIFPKLQATCHTALSLNHRSPVRLWWNLKSKATPRLISDFILEHAHNEHINPSKLMFNNIRKQPSNSTSSCLHP